MAKESGCTPQDKALTSPKPWLPGPESAEVRETAQTPERCRHVTGMLSGACSACSFYNPEPSAQGDTNYSGRSPPTSAGNQEDARNQPPGQALAAELFSSQWL